MTKREQALATITAMVAKEGRASQYALREYVENRISREAFNRAVAQGMRLYQAEAAR